MKIYSYINFILLIAILWTSKSISQNYMWPTNASTYLSSSFCEFRDGHYHSAIDIKTWLVEGYPVYAVEDGYIERIRVSPFGYGKVLYLRLTDSKIAVYAHLQRFTPLIDKEVRKRQLNNQKYRLNWYPKNLRVKKGDVLAYTGRTGIGLPHLHFEIRDTDNCPINPLLFYPNIKDSIRPRLQRIALIPISRGTTINGGYLPQIFPLTYVKDGLYVVKESIKANGKIGLAIMGYDQADDVSNIYGFHQTIMEVDGKEVFNLLYDKLDFSTTSHIYTETYYPFWASLRQVYHKLFVESFNPLNFYKRYPDTDGTINTGKKPITFTISVLDFKGNCSKVKGEIIPDSYRPIRIEYLKRNKNTAYIKFKSQPIKDINFYTGIDKSSFTPVKYFEIINGTISNPDKNITAKINLQDSSYNLLKIAISSFDDQLSERIISLANNLSNDSNFSLHFIDDNMIFESNGYYGNGSLILLPLETKFNLNYVSDGKLQALIPGNILKNGKNELQLQSNAKIIWSQNIETARIFPNEGRSTNWVDSSFSIITSKSAFLDTTLLSVSYQPGDSLAEILPLASRVYKIYPNTVPLFDNILITIRPDSLPAWGKWAIFKTDGKESFSYLNSTFINDSTIIQAETKSLGSFVVACDTIAPFLDIQSPKAGFIYTKNPDIILNLYDQQAGIGNEENISILLDGEFILPEWDPEEKSVTAHSDKNLIKGSHILTVSISDLCGNTKRRAVYFNIR